MTRINSDLHPEKLHRVHLVAELREITMVPAALKRSLRSRPPEAIIDSIPRKFTLNKGHVTFFYDKLDFLIKRFHKLADEMERRGYNVDRSREKYFYGFDKMWYNDWQSTPEDDEIIMERILLRISQKPHLYK